jgi:ankyrin repeat protein
MDSRLSSIFDEIRENPLWEGVVFDDVNALNPDGDNVLHWAVRRNDMEVARLVIECGINVNQHGDLGRTPLHEACGCGHREMVRLLVEHGADLYAQTEGETPFYLARLTGHDDICDFLRPLMDQAQARDSQVWVRLRITHLQRELRRLEALLK